MSNRPMRINRAAPVGRLVSRSVVSALIVCLTGAIASVNAETLKVVELFTSHGCSSCPPADELLGQLIEDDPELVALEFHVDYWNALVHGGDGNFVDPYSSKAFTERQRDYYGASLMGRPGVYTPQAVVNGRVAAVGSNRRDIRAALDQDIAPSVSVTIARDGDSLVVEVDPVANARIETSDAEIRLVRFHRERTTDITGGENRHRTLENHHVVHASERLGPLEPSGGQRFRVAASAPGDGCAVLVQNRLPSPILGAASCPP